MKTLLMTISLLILCLVPAGAKSQTLETIEDGTVQPPLSSETIGTFNSVVYVRYKGQFAGVTQGGRFVVPYEVTVPLNPSEGNGIVIFEPPDIDADAAHIADVTAKQDASSEGQESSVAGTTLTGCRSLELC